MKSALGVYLHVPFCRTRCRYCDFYRVGESPERRASFLEAVLCEIETTPEILGRRVDTVFFGGGTPSLLEPTQVARVLEGLTARCEVADEAEITLESNPSDLGPERLDGYLAAGVTRLSLGVQSFVDRELTLLGRRHDAERAERVFGQAREAGFDNISLDLMLAIPGQTEAGFRSTLRRTLALEPDHLSVYLLEIHNGSEMDYLRRERPGLFPAEEAQRRRYLKAVEVLTAGGLEHYEVSNFCRPGRPSRHNLKYWLCEDYVGFGPAAHSLVKGLRWRHRPDLAAYLENPTEREELPVDLVTEKVFLGLRLARGVPVEWLLDATGADRGQLARRVGELEGLVERCRGRLRLTTKGQVVSTAVLGELLRPARATRSIST